MATTTDILTKLIEKSRDGKIAWRATSGRQKFLTMLGETGVSIDFDAATKLYELDIINRRGRLIESISAKYDPEGFQGITSETIMARALRELHGIARRSALDVESTLDELANRLDAIV